METKQPLTQTEDILNSIPPPRWRLRHPSGDDIVQPPHISLSDWSWCLLLLFAPLPPSR